MATKKKAKSKTAKKATAKKATAKKAPAKKAPGKKTPAKKAAAEKSPAKAEQPVTAKAAAPAETPATKPAPKRAAAASGRRIRVTLVKSVHGRLAAHQACAMGLGLRRRHQTVEVEDTPCTRGMINRIRYLLEVEGQ